MSSRDLKDCVQELQYKVPLIIQDYNNQFSNRELFITCTLRSTQEQQAIFAVGRTIPPIGKKYWLTQIDGVTKFSNHNPTPTQPLARAVDFGVLVGGKYMKPDFYYYPLLELARKYSLRSGWDFHDTGYPIEVIIKDKYFHDGPHIEIV